MLAIFSHYSVIKNMLIYALKISESILDVARYEGE